METISSMLLIITVVAAKALIQAHFPARFGQSGKLSCPELKFFRVGGALYVPFELFAGRFRWKRLLYFIRAVGLPTRSSLRIAAGGLRYVALLPVQPGWNPLLPYVEYVTGIGLTLAISKAAAVSQTAYSRRQKHCRLESMMIASLYSKNAASWRCRAPIQSMELMCGEYRLAGSFFSNFFKQNDDEL